MATKIEILEALRDLPEDATIDDAIDYLVYLSGIEEGLADEEAGRMITHEELISRIKSWLK